MMDRNYLILIILLCITTNVFCQESDGSKSIGVDIVIQDFNDNLPKDIFQKYNRDTFPNLLNPNENEQKIIEDDPTLKILKGWFEKNKEEAEKYNYGFDFLDDKVRTFKNSKIIADSAKGNATPEKIAEAIDEWKKKVKKALVVVIEAETATVSSQKKELSDENDTIYLKVIEYYSIYLSCISGTLDQYISGMKFDTYEFPKEERNGKTARITESIIFQNNNETKKSETPTLILECKKITVEGVEVPIEEIIKIVFEKKEDDKNVRKYLTKKIKYSVGNNNFEGDSLVFDVYPGDIIQLKSTDNKAINEIGISRIDLIKNDDKKVLRKIIKEELSHETCKIIGGFYKIRPVAVEEYKLILYSDRYFNGQYFTIKQEEYEVLSYTIFYKAPPMDLHFLEIGINYGTIQLSGLDFGSIVIKNSISPSLDIINCTFNLYIPWIGRYMELGGALKFLTTGILVKSDIEANNYETTIVIGGFSLKVDLFNVGLGWMLYGTPINIYGPTVSGQRGLNANNLFLFLDVEIMKALELLRS